MKNFLLSSGLSLLMVLSASSCGKKPNDKKKNIEDSTIDEIQSPTIEEGHYELLEAIKNDDIIQARLILNIKSNVDLNKILKDEETLLTTAVILNNPQAVDLLLENNASIMATNKNKETPIMVAARLGHEEMVKKLVIKGSKTDNKDLDGNTALHMAILNSNEDIAIYLIQSNTNIDITNNENQTALKIAEELKLKRVISLLRSLTQAKVGLPEPLTVKNLLALGDADNFKILINDHPDILTEYIDLNFYVLVMRSHTHDKALNMTYLLSDLGADLNGPKNAEATPLIEAIKMKYVDIVEYMLSKNVDPNILDSKGNSPLVWAIEMSSPEIVKLLLDKNASKYYFELKDNKSRPVRACNEARLTRKELTKEEDKAANEEIMKLLGCSFIWSI